MVDSQALLADLQREVTRLEDDIRARCDAELAVDAPLKARYDEARNRSRTALTYKAWREGVAFDRERESTRLPLDASWFRQDGHCMATRKPAQPLKETPTKGAVLAAKYRARANALSDAERQRHRAHAMSLIYGNPNGPALHARSR